MSSVLFTKSEHQDEDIRLESNFEGLKQDENPQPLWSSSLSRIVVSANNNSKNCKNWQDFIPFLFRSLR